MTVALQRLLEADVGDHVGVQHVQQGVDILLRAHVLQGGKVEHGIERAGVGQHAGHDRAAVVDGDGLQLGLAHTLGPPAQTAHQLDQVVLADVGDEHRGRFVTEQQAGRGRADGAAAAHHQDALSADRLAQGRVALGDVAGEQRAVTA